MEKMAIKVTLTSVTAPLLFPYLASIQDAKQRAHALRHMAELGYAAFLARQPIQAAAGAGVAQLQAAAPSLPRGLRPAASVEREAWPGPVHAGETDEATPDASALPSGGMATAMTEHLNDAMNRFFTT